MAPSFCAAILFTYRVHHTNSKSHCQQCKITPVQGQLKCLCTFLSSFAPSEKYWPIFNLSFSVQFLDGRPVNFFIIHTQIKLPLKKCNLPSRHTAIFKMAPLHFFGKIGPIFQQEFHQVCIKLKAQKPGNSYGTKYQHSYQFMTLKISYIKRN